MSDAGRPRAEGLMRLPDEPTETVRAPRSWPMPIGVAATILAMFGPWLRSGVVLGLDTPVNLIGPYPRASIAVGARPPELAARAPVDAVLSSLYLAFPWGQVRLLP